MTSAVDVVPARTHDRRSAAVTTQPAAIRPGLGRASARQALVVLTVAALAIRLLIDRGFSLTEAAGGYESRLSYSALVHQVLRSSGGPIQPTVLWVVAHTIGSTPTELRLPSVVFGTLTVPVLYLAGRALFHERAGLLAALVGTLGPLAVWYSQDAGPGALVILLTTVTIWVQQRALTTDRRRWWLAWAAGARALVWTEWSAVFVVGVEIAVTAWTVTRHPRTTGEGPIRGRAVRPLVATTGVVAVVALAAPVLLAQTAHSAGPRPGGLATNGIAGALVATVWGYHRISLVADAVALWPLGIVGILVVLGRGRHRSQQRLIALLVAPVTATLIAGAIGGRGRVETADVVDAVPVLYLLLAAMAWTSTPTVRARRAFATGLTALVALGLVLQQTDGANPQIDGDQTAFAQIAATARPGAVIVYAPADSGSAVGYFIPQLRRMPIGGVVDSLRGSAQVFVVGSFGAGQSPPRHAAAAAVRRLEAHHHLVATLRGPDIIVWELS